MKAEEATTADLVASPITPAAANLAATLPFRITVLRGQHKPNIPLRLLRTEQPRTRPLRTQPQVAADMEAAVADTKVAADTTKLLLLHRAAVCTTGGGAYQLRRFCFADNISDCIAPRWTSHSDRQRQGRLLRGKHRRRIEAIHIGLFSLGQIVSDSIGLDLIRADLIGADLIVFDLIRI